jgi:hypothetical protein
MTEVDLVKGPYSHPHHHSLHAPAVTGRKGHWDVLHEVDRAGGTGEGRPEEGIPSGAWNSREREEEG